MTTAPVKDRPNFGHRRWFLIFACGLAALLAVLQNQFCTALTIGTSMLPTLMTGDLLIVNKRAYCDSMPERGDIVVAKYHEQLIVKRVVALPGEEVEVEYGKLYVNKVLVPEDFSIKQSPLIIGKGRLLMDKFAILGDNRALPIDLTVFAVVPKSDIVGKLVWIIPFSRLYERGP